MFCSYAIWSLSCQALFLLSRENSCVLLSSNPAPYTNQKKLLLDPHSLMPTIPFLPLSLNAFPAFKKTSNTRKEVKQTKNLHALLHWRSILNLTTAVFSLFWDVSPFVPATRKHTYSSEGFNIKSWTDLSMRRGQRSICVTDGFQFRSHVPRA